MTHRSITGSSSGRLVILYPRSIISCNWQHLKPSWSSHNSMRQSPSYLSEELLAGHIARQSSISRDAFPLKSVAYKGSRYLVVKWVSPLEWFPPYRVLSWQALSCIKYNSLTSSVTCHWARLQSGRALTFFFTISSLPTEIFAFRLTQGRSA